MKVLFIPFENRKWSGEEDYVKVIRPDDDKTCNSLVGRWGGQQKIRLGKRPDTKTCYREKVIVHEFIHAIGFTHEQNRFDRDLYINIRWENVKGGKKNKNYKKVNKQWLNGSTEYDGKSVMHYPAGKQMTSLVCSL